MTQNKKSVEKQNISSISTTLGGSLVNSLTKHNKKNLQVGDTCELRITALAPNNIGIDEFTYPYTIFVPNAKYGSVIKAKILKINSTVPVSKGEVNMGNKQGVSLKKLPSLLKAPVSNSLSLQEASLLKLQKEPILNNSSQYLTPKGGMLSKTISFAIAKIVEETPFPSAFGEIDTLENAPVKPGEVLTVSITKEIPYSDSSTSGNTNATLRSAGIVELSNKFSLIIPLWASEDTPRENLKVVVTRVKSNYAFAKIEGLNYKRNVQTLSNKSEKQLILKGEQLNATKLADENLFLKEYDVESARNLANKCLSLDTLKLTTGLKFTTTLPTNAPAYGNYLVYKLKNTILFVVNPENKKASSTPKKDSQTNNSVPVFSENKVRIKIISSSKNCVIGKILQFNPITKKQKMALVMNSIRDMINHGLHFGEKAVKCHARMKKYLWLKKSSVSSYAQSEKGFNSEEKVNGSAPLFYVGLVKNSLSTQLSPQTFRSSFPYIERGEALWQTGASALPSALFRAAEEQRQASEKRPLIKKGRHIINLLKTRRCLNKALNILTKYALKGRTFLFIGTKKPATGLIARASFFTKNSFYVNTRWLGGMLTNWKTICKSISKIRPILKEKQKVVRDILERRQTIKTQLIQKALLLRRKSKFILTKGRFVLSLLKDNGNSLIKTVGFNKDGNQVGSFGAEERSGLAYNQNTGSYDPHSSEMITRAHKLIALRNDFISKGKNYLQKRQRLIQKRRLFIYETLLLKEKGLLMSNKYKTVLNQLALYTKKLREYKYLLILTSEIQQIKTMYSPEGQAQGFIDSSDTVSGQNKELYSISYGKLKEIQNQFSYKWIIPNPPKEILNRIVLTMKNQSTLQTPSITSETLSGATSYESGKSVNTNSSQILICSTLLSKFSSFGSYIKTVIQNLLDSINLLKKQAAFYETELTNIKTTLVSYLDFKKNYLIELQNLKTNLTTERNVIRIVKRKLKALDAQKKLIQFLPRLRYLPTPQTKISQMVQILLSKIVDPKLKYPIEIIYDQKLSTSSKKLAAARKKKWQRLEKYFGGISNMTKFTKTNISRNVAIIIGQKEEINAVRECKKLGIKMFTIVDTNCNPTLSDHIIPANDDSRNSIKYILTKFVTRIRLAQKLRTRLQKLQKTN